MSNELTSAIAPRRLRLLLMLARTGSMRAVAEATGMATSTVSQQLAVLARDTRTTLLERDGRRVRLTSAGHRLAGHAVVILDALEAAGRDLDPSGEPHGSIRVAAQASSVRHWLLPVHHHLRSRHPQVRLIIEEREPAESLRLIEHDGADIALTYDFNLAPWMWSRDVSVRRLTHEPWGLALPPQLAAGTPPLSPTSVALLRDADWIVNSRDDGDERVVRLLTAQAGFAPKITHRVDSISLIHQLVAAGLGVGLLPLDYGAAPAAVVPASDVDLDMRRYAVTRRTRSTWPAVTLVLRLLTRLAEGTSLDDGCACDRSADGAASGVGAQVPAEMRDGEGDPASFAGVDQALLQ